MRLTFAQRWISRLNIAAVLLAGAICLAGWHGTARAQGATADDTARFLAGMQPTPASPLAELAKHPAWERHARWFEANWDVLERRQLSKVRAWRDAHLKDRARTLYYMFSGPDFLYANAFFPEAPTYLMSGLEPVGAIPLIGERTLRSLPRIQSVLASSLQFSFFITRNLREQMQSGELSGTLPILYIYIARAGGTIRGVKLVSLDKDGAVHESNGRPDRGMAPGVKIAFTAGKGTPQTLYYFQSDISNSGTRYSGFFRFAASLGLGNSLLKSASYLMHSGNFTQVRDFVLQHSLSVVQDDSGIPLDAFKSDGWQLHPFGKYLGPIDIFPGRYQPRLAALFRNAPPLEFGIGYRHRGYDSNLLLAVKKQNGTPPRQADGTPPARPYEAVAGDPKLRPSVNAEE
jgi:hypothetical protein